MNLELKKYIEHSILPQYNAFDKAHNLSHVQTVIDESLELAKNYCVNMDMVYTIAAYHNTGLCSDHEPRSSSK